MALWSRHTARYGFLVVLLLLGSDDQAPAHPTNPSGAIAPATFEDIYGPSGAKFQAALGFRVAEATTATGDAQTSFGVTVDDMVVQWREFKIVEDGTSCATSGSCASISLDTTTIYEANGSLGITVLDRTPYGQSSPVSDCNQDGDFVDGGIDDADCNDNGVSDVIVRASSPGEPAGEPVVLDRVGTLDTYRGTLPISSAFDAPGVLHLAAAAQNNPEITIRYNDRWDGSASGIECRASADPSAWGTVSAQADIPFAPLFTVLPELVVASYRISDVSGTGTPPLPAGQDGDGFPDTNEMVDLFLTIRNPSGTALTDVVAQISTSDPKVDCILASTTHVASLAAHASVELPAALRFKVAPTADRSGTIPAVSCNSGACGNGAGSCNVPNDCKKATTDTYAATFVVALAAGSPRVEAVTAALPVELDLNSLMPLKATSTFTEGFESGFTNFVLLNLDDSIASNTLSNGRRCQYNDPDFVGGQSYGDTECYLGFVLGQPIVNDWQIYDTSQPDHGRAYLGVRSLWYGVSTPGNPGKSTYGLSQMDAVRSKDPLNLAARVCANDTNADKRACNAAPDCVGFGGGPCIAAAPQLSFKQQVSLVDNRSTNTPDGESTDRGVVHAQVFGAGAVWEKLTPYQNVYDVRGTDYFSYCMFDPIDDGNTEDDYFDPSDPQRRLGPSSTCYPEFVFAFQGDTDEAFAPSKIGRASEGPGLQGSLGAGTWVESKFDLSRFRGRRIRIRWLVTSIKFSDTRTWEALFHWNPRADDDGWYVDDVRVTQTLGTTAPTLTQDTTSNSGIPACGSTCSTLSAVLTPTPAVTPSPGSPVGFSTAGSLADRCIGGVVLSEFWIDGDANGILGDPADVLLRPATVDPLFDDAPLVTTHYAARVFCSSAPACAGTAFAVVTVGCPGTPGVYNAEAWWTRLSFGDKTTLETPPAGQSIDAARGDLGALRATGSFGGEVCLADGVASPTLVDASIPASGGGYYYLLRGADAFCNENRSWRTFSARENPTDPTRRDTQIGVCAP